MFSNEMMAVSLSTLQTWPNSPEDYDLIKVIAMGNSAVVYSARCVTRDEKCAIKRVFLENGKSTLDEVTKEIKALSSCSHENVVTYYTSFVVRDELWLVMKLLEGGSVRDVIKYKMKISNCKFGCLNETTIATVLYEVLKGLRYFHGTGQIHRDIKSANVLLGLDGIVQLAGFRLSTYLKDEENKNKTTRYTYAGPSCWMAPEVMEQKNGQNYKADIWSIGITAIEMATGFAPYFKYPAMKILFKTIYEDPPNLDTEVDEPGQYKAYGETFRKMIEYCLQKDPNKRPTAAELLQHPFFKKAQDRKSLAKILDAVEPSMAAKIQKFTKMHYNVAAGIHNGLDNWRYAEEDTDDSSSEDENRPMNEIKNEESESESDVEGAAGENVSCQSELSVDQDVNNLNLGSDTPNIKEDLPVVLNMVLRLRNSSRELNDIYFEYFVGKDTPKSITDELISAGLLDPRDSVPLTLTLDNLLKHKPLESPKTVIFALNSVQSEGQFDSQFLIGYARITIV